MLVAGTGTAMEPAPSFKDLGKGLVDHAFLSKLSKPEGSWKDPEGHCGHLAALEEA